MWVWSVCVYADVFVYGCMNVLKCVRMRVCMYVYMYTFIL